MENGTFPARLHVLVARDSDKAIVIRRGPSKQTCVLAWNRSNDSFEVAQWLKGRIYEKRSDISPSGKYWIYFAMNGKWHSQTKGSWTAVSRAPWLKAISLYAKGNAWHGGGLFLDDKAFWLNDDKGLHELIFASDEVKRHLSYTPPEHYGGECLHVYFNRLQRDGWALADILTKKKWHHQFIFERELNHRWHLRKISHSQDCPPLGKGCYWDEHEVYNAQGVGISGPSWEWADWIDGHIVYAEHGCLYRITPISEDKLGEPQLLHDFNDYQFEPRQAPY